MTSRTVQVGTSVLALLLLAGLPTVALAGDEDKGTGRAGAEIGKPAPAFTLKNYDGKDVSLKDFAGKVVIVEWFNHECPFIKARHEKRDIYAEVMKNFTGKAVVWVAIDSTAAHDVKQIEKAAGDLKIKFPILADQNGATGKAYGASNTPHLFVIDKSGNLAYKGALDDDPQSEKGEKAKNYVVGAVNAVLAGSTVENSSTKAYGCTIKYGGGTK